MNKEGAIAGMVAGIVFTAVYITWFKLVHPELNSAENWLFGISPEGIGAVGMLINFAIALIVSRVTEEPPRQVQALVEEIRVPRRTDEVREISV
jgi:cation/acetate symporter